MRDEAGEIERASLIKKLTYFLKEFVIRSMDCKQKNDRIHKI